MPLHPLTSLEAQRHQNESAVKQAQRSFNGIYSRNSLLKIRDGA